MRVIPFFGLAMMLASPASAQETDGWDVETVPARQITVASLRYENGSGLAVQCRDGELNTILFGLPPGDTTEPSEGYTSRRLDTGVEGATVVGHWRASPDGTSAVRNGYARGVRQMKRGGRFVIRTVPVSNEPVRRLIFDLPADPSGLDQVLTACGRPTVDPRDELRDLSEYVNVDQRHPGLSSNDTIGNSSFEYSCIVAPGGRVRDCVIEAERPTGRGIGDRLLRSAPRARFNMGDDPESLVGGIFYVRLTTVTRMEIMR